MPHIQQLAPHVADLIAAGEVVERPASVVKELLENAIDAGASAVTVEIQNGGMASIRVTDNGCGIPPEELPTAFLRHATSKLRTAQDLAAIGTLGFRGEALAAISAVSRLDVFSRAKGAVSGASLSLEGGVPGAVESAGCPEGTTMVIRDLFYNTPARLKFMKKDSAEASAVGSILQQVALSHPEVSIRYLRDGKEELFTPGDGKLLSAIYAARGRDFALHLTEVNGGGEGVSVRGYVTEPLAGRGTRALQTFFCCGRTIKSPLLTAALEEAYLNRQLKGKFPGCVLHIDLPLHLVDVNVHPAKTVVKFADERAVFSAVHHVVKDALDGVGSGAAVTVSAKTPSAVVNPRQDFYQTMDAKTFRETAGKTGKKLSSPEMGGRLTFRDSAPATIPAAFQKKSSAPVSGFGAGKDTALFQGREDIPTRPRGAGETFTPKTTPTRPLAAAPGRQTSPRSPLEAVFSQGMSGSNPAGTAPAAADNDLPAVSSVPAFGKAPGELRDDLREDAGAAVTSFSTAAPAEQREEEEVPRPEAPATPEAQSQPSLFGEAGEAPSAGDRENLPGQLTVGQEKPAPWRFAGEIFHTYIIAEDGDTVWLIDKHAAHERINFDRLKAQAEPIMGQQLLAPVVLDLPQEQYAALLEQLPLLEEFGFVAEDFGSGSLVVRSIPSDIETGQIRETLEELAEKLLTCGSADSAAARDALLHTMACKAAIKGGWHSDEAELRFLIDKVQSGEVQFCPHGRPVKVKLTRYEVEKMFKRA